jgi:hypothetical protein
MAKTLGLSFFFHDSAAALVCDGQIVAAAAEERFCRRKHTNEFPKRAIEYCLEAGRLASINELDAIVFYEKPIMKFLWVVEAMVVTWPLGLATFARRLPALLASKFNICRTIEKNLTTLELEATVVPPTRYRSLKRFVNSLPFYPWLLEHSHLVQLLRLRAEKMVRLSQPSGTVGEVKPPDPDVVSPASDTTYAVALGQALFRRLKGWCAVHGVELFVLTTGYQRWHLAHPELFQISVGPANVAFFQQAETFFQREGILFKDIAPEVIAASGGRVEDLIIPGDGHPNEAGSELIAFSAWNWLRPQLQEIMRK